MAATLVLVCDKCGKREVIEIEPWEMEKPIDALVDPHDWGVPMEVLCPTHWREAWEKQTNVPFNKVRKKDDDD